jgi:cytochrome c-type biogenesis protein CcmH/NrfG
MLKLAVIEQDEDAIATLSAIGIIAIDEATYVQAVTSWWRVLMIL